MRADQTTKLKCLKAMGNWHVTVLLLLPLMFITSAGKDTDVIMCTLLSCSVVLIVNRAR